MRINIVSNMKALLQQDKKRNSHRWLLLLFGGAFAILYFSVILPTYLWQLKHKDASDQASVDSYEQRMVLVDAYITPDTKGSETSKRIFHHTDNHPAGPIAREEVTNNPMHLEVTGGTSTDLPTHNMHTTSSATVHHVGSGLAAGQAAEATTYVSSSVPFSSSMSNMVLPTAIWTSARALTARNTISTEQRLIAANNADESAKAMAQRRVTDHPLDPFMDPVGDGLWVLFLAATAYVGAIVVRRKRQQR